MLRVDKLLHMSVSAVITFVVSFKLSASNTTIVALLIGIGKEFSDKHWFKNHESDVDDIIADIAGIVVGLFAYKLFRKVFK